MAVSGTTLFNPDLSELSELWVPVVGYEGLYEVSSFGRVRSVSRVIEGRWGPTKRSGVLLKIHPSKSGTSYPKVTLCRDGDMTQISVHTLVLEAFIGPCPEGFQADHIDFDVFNNSLYNLRWIHEDDNQERRRHLKLSKQIAKDIVDRLQQGIAPTALAEEYGVSVRHVKEIGAGERWRMNDEY